MKEKIAEGKTKRIWRLKNYQVEIESKDDITAGDGAKRDIIEDKAVLANNTTCNIFEMLNRCKVETHFIERISEKSFSAIECLMLDFEVVIRRIGVGSYQKRNLDVPEGTVFPDLVVEFFYKDDSLHDPFIVFSGKKWNLYNPKEPITSESLIKTISPICLRGETKHIIEEAKKIFIIIEEAWRKQGIVLYDLKIEFGRHSKYPYKILLADVIDNDSWRIRTKDGEQLDKQVYRDGGDLKEVKNKYEIVSELTNNFRNIKIEI